MIEADYMRSEENVYIDQTKIHKEEKRCGNYNPYTITPSSSGLHPFHLFHAH